MTFSDAAVYAVLSALAVVGWSAVGYVARKTWDRSKGRP